MIFISMLPYFSYYSPIPPNQPADDVLPVFNFIISPVSNFSNGFSSSSSLLTILRLFHQLPSKSLPVYDDIANLIFCLLLLSKFWGLVYFLPVSLLYLMKKNIFPKIFQLGFLLSQKSRPRDVALHFL